MNRSARIFVAGHLGLVGSALVRQLIAAGYENLLTRSRKELDLANQAAVAGFFTRKSLSTSSSRPRRLAVFWQTRPARRISFEKIF